MWKRRDLKEKAKASVKANYWKSVLVALLVAVIAGGVGGAGGASSASTIAGNIARNNSALVQTQSDYDYDYDDLSEYTYMDNDDAEANLEQMMRDIDANTSPSEKAALAVGAGIAVMIVVLVILVVVVIACVLDALIFNPLAMGAERFFLCNLNQKAEVKELAFVFDSNYKQIAKTLFLRDLYIVLWGLLLIVPGIIKAYQYRMVGYLLNDNPNLTTAEALEQSKQMMQGNKWKAFVLDLSFIGWHLLSGLTLGLLSIFYVAPYQNQTNAALYEALRYNAPTLPNA
ncbi:MAG: DUF975 family protein [Coriobacteriales bacterium]|nr:DUF975 family protein [Coriobacteriales bacterium]